MNIKNYGVISHVHTCFWRIIEAIRSNVHEVFNASDKQAKKELFDDLYHHVRYTKPCGAEPTTVALDADKLLQYFSFMLTV